ncbi:MAG: PfkB family carbohydrate kinase, partial [Pseudomonadales bacterium]
MDIAVIGSNMIDLVAYTDQVPQVGETLEANDFAMACGGKGANQAVAAARLGAQVGFLSKVGDDQFAQTQLESLQGFGVDTRWVSAAQNMSSGVAQITVDGDGNNRILIIPGANKQLAPADIDAIGSALKQVKLIVLQLEVPLATVYHAIEFANAAHIPVILNPAPATPKLNIDYACRCDYFIPNETELA